jgi:hypothetical protein
VAEPYGRDWEQHIYEASRPCKRHLPLRTINQSILTSTDLLRPKPAHGLWRKTPRICGFDPVDLLSTHFYLVSRFRRPPSPPREGRMPPGEPSKRVVTPEPMETSAAPSAPYPPRTSNRATRAPVSYVQEQEKEAAGKLEKRHRRNQTETSLRGIGTTGHLAILPGEHQMQGILQTFLDSVIKSGNFHNYLQQEIEVRHGETTKLRAEITELRHVRRLRAIPRRWPGSYSQLQ